MGAHGYSGLETLMSLIVHRAPIRRRRVARMHRMIDQAAYVRDALAAYARPSGLETLDAYCALPQLPRRRRVRTVFRYRFWPKKLTDRLVELSTVRAL